MSVLFFIPARAGSKGVKDKNLQQIGGRSLTKIAVDFLCNAGFAQSTVLSSDSEVILSTCWAEGVLCDKRPENMSTDYATTAATIKEFICSGRGQCELSDEDWVVIVEPTSPFRTQKTLDNLLRVIDENLFDSVFTVYKSSAVEWLSNDGSWSRRDNVDGKLSRRQSRSPKFIEAGVFYATKVRNIMSESVVGQKSHCLTVDEVEALDINSPLDLEVCRAVFNNLRAV